MSEPTRPKKDDKSRPEGRRKKERDRQLDEALEGTFPASDPPAITQPVHREETEERD